MLALVTFLLSGFRGPERVPDGRRRQPPVVHEQQALVEKVLVEVRVVAQPAADNRFHVVRSRERAGSYFQMEKFLQQLGGTETLRPGLVPGSPPVFEDIGEIFDAAVEAVTLDLAVRPSRPGSQDHPDGHEEEGDHEDGRADVEQNILVQLHAVVGKPLRLKNGR